MTKKSGSDRVIAVNRKAFHEYSILETWEAGLALRGTEVKSIREGKVNIRDAYARPEKGELWLVGAHIARYPPGGVNNHDPMRPRKLLLHRRELDYIIGQLSTKGTTVVPLRLYLKDGRIKAEIALVRGKKVYDRRREIQRREEQREISRLLKYYRDKFRR